MEDFYFMLAHLAPVDTIDTLIFVNEIQHQQAATTERQRIGRRRADRSDESMNENCHVIFGHAAVASVSLFFFDIKTIYSI